MVTAFKLDNLNARKHTVFVALRDLRCDMTGEKKKKKSCGIHRNNNAKLISHGNHGDSNAQLLVQ